MSVNDDVDDLTPPPSPNNLNFTKSELAKAIENEKLIDQSNVKAVARPAIDGEPPLQVVLKPPKPESKYDLKPSKSGRKPSMTNPATSKGPATRGLKSATGKPIHPPPIQPHHDAKARKENTIQAATANAAATDFWSSTTFSRSKL
ncbi:Aste57867_13648 [Aphanomyces stellatus]|uniref:Aste57867_13648 protein n=1 Tax=Aphanomyces stellatus TaxID=120398 RepID=A0A485L0V3_9STRA|nr:hypothetical protein As57867_013598 [Aphanomyces stellatus]VFT90484.1 Aste57867_13648 [Aphanomyces stellatus]